MQNPAAVLHGPSKVLIEDWPVEDPLPGEIQVRVKSVGICGTDVQYWKSGALFDQPLPQPMVLGHETSAEVVKLGPGVEDFKPGDRVHLHPAPACHRCRCCLAGHEHNCQRIKLGKMFHGHIRRILNHPAENTIRLPEGVSYDEGALIEPWVVGVYAVERSGLTPGQSCVIIGAGAIGAMTFLAAKLTSASKICVVDISQSKLDMIFELGDCQTILASQDPKQTAERVERAVGQKPDVAIDATCTQPGIATAIYSCAPCGKVVLAGLAPDDCTLPMQHAAINELDILNMVRFGHCYPRAMRLVEERMVNLKPLVAARFPLAETQQALQATAGGLKSGFKVIVDCTQ